MQVENGILQLMSALVKNSASLPQTQQSQGSSFGDLLDDRLQGAQQDPSQAQQNTAGNTTQQEDGSSSVTEKPQLSQEDANGTQTVPEDQQPAASLWAASMMAPAQWNLQAPEVAAPQVVENTTPVAVVPVEVQTVPQAAETAQGLQAPVEQLAAQPQEMVPQETGEAQPQVEQPVQQAQQPAQAQVNTQAGEQQSQQGSGLQQPQVETKTQQDSLDVQVQEAPVETSQAVFGQVESAPVKVSDIPQTQETEQTPDVESQISKGLTRALEQGDTKVEIQLNPASLGNVRIEVTRSAEGALYVVLTAEHQQTQGLLERHAAGLQAMLMGASSAENVEVHVQRQQEGQQAANQSYDGSSGNGRENQQQEHRRQQPESQDFLQQLRLGLVPAQVTNL